MADFDKIAEKIQEYSMQKLINSWRNAVRIKSNRKDRRRHPQAKWMIDAVEQEWLRRGMSKELLEGFFEWPGTNADGGDGTVNAEDWYKLGVLKVLGYTVGREGEAKRVREQILKEVFRTYIPPVFPAIYISEWGGPETAYRLKKMAETIAAFTRNAKRRRDSRMSEAIRDWEADLNFLYLEYYVERFGFDWPKTCI